MTLKECIENFKKEWYWIAEETLRLKRKVYKYEYFCEHKLENVTSYCYLCEYSEQKYISKFHNEKCSCTFCPAIKDEEPEGFICCNGLYNLWEFATDYKICAKLAKQIAECPLEEWAIAELEKDGE